MDTAKQLVEMCRKFLIAFHRLASFLRVKEALGARAGGFP
jgi:hypothetical protein